MVYHVLNRGNGRMKIFRKVGDAMWTAQMARKLGLQYTLNPRGRPSKQVQPAAERRK